MERKSTACSSTARPSTSRSSCASPEAPGPARAWGARRPGRPLPHAAGAGGRCPRTAWTARPSGPPLSGTAPSTASVYSETLYPRYHFGWSELFAVTDARYRYVRAPRRELFDVADVGEKRNLAGDRATVVRGHGPVARPEAGGGAPAPEDVPADVRES